MAAGFTAAGVEAGAPLPRAAGGPEAAGCFPLEKTRACASGALSSMGHPAWATLLAIARRP